MTKRCSNCQLEKERTEFATDNVQNDGLSKWCVGCTGHATSAKSPKHVKKEPARRSRKKTNPPETSTEEVNEAPTE